MGVRKSLVHFFSLFALVTTPSLYGEEGCSDDFSAGLDFFGGAGGGFIGAISALTGDSCTSQNTREEICRCSSGETLPQTGSSDQALWNFYGEIFTEEALQLFGDTFSDAVSAGSLAGASNLESLRECSFHTFNKESFLSNPVCQTQNSAHRAEFERRMNSFFQSANLEQSISERYQSRNNQSVSTTQCISRKHFYQSGALFEESFTSEEFTTLVQELQSLDQTIGESSTESIWRRLIGSGATAEHMMIVEKFIKHPFYVFMFDSPTLSRQIMQQVRSERNITPERFAAIVHGVEKNSVASELSGACRSYKDKVARVVCRTDSPYFLTMELYSSLESMGGISSSDRSFLAKKMCTEGNQSVDTLVAPALGYSSSTVSPSAREELENTLYNRLNEAVCSQYQNTSEQMAVEQWWNDNCGQSSTNALCQDVKVRELVQYHQRNRSVGNSVNEINLEQSVVHNILTDATYQIPTTSVVVNPESTEGTSIDAEAMVGETLGNVTSGGVATDGNSGVTISNANVVSGNQGTQKVNPMEGFQIVPSEADHTAVAGITEQGRAVDQLTEEGEEKLNAVRNMINQFKERNAATVSQRVVEAEPVANAVVNEPVTFQGSIGSNGAGAGYVSNEYAAGPSSDFYQNGGHTTEEAVLAEEVHHDILDNARERFLGKGGENLSDSSEIEGGRSPSSIGVGTLNLGSGGGGGLVVGESGSQPIVSQDSDGNVIVRFNGLTGDTPQDFELRFDELLQTHIATIRSSSNLVLEVNVGNSIIRIIKDPLGIKADFDRRIQGLSQLAQSLLQKVVTRL